MFCQRTRYSHPPKLLYALSCAILFACITLNLFVNWGWVNTRTAHIYSYLGDDFPETFAIGPLSQASIFIENTVHYQINTSDATSEWQTLFPTGGGYVHLGPRQRPFLLSMYHQLYCLRLLKNTIATSSSGRMTDQLEQEHRCLNYLRQAILCEPSLRLEPESQRIEDLGLPSGVDGLGLEHNECKDWSTVFNAVGANQKIRV
ncbi:hypothetical protein NEOLEDRAFT_1170688 [Neolentinus lepideus HHB14362 ss-1]|uniref:Uncharacterized protein n=1 Tax=Neolentinus lepideus HHB14362 ss-1 TaxID=1314782 RepID=A0A165RB58_9AGAM|nr:hypothetical protein NEOLEDRAFT_1170688 [Neolentinus lepideus HHB14362 ss-1]